MQILVGCPLDLPVLRSYVRSIYTDIIRRDVLSVVLVGRVSVFNEMVLSSVIVGRLYSSTHIHASFL